MNEVIKLFSEISDEELKNAIQEIKDGEKDGIIIGNGIVRKYAELTRDITGQDTSSNLFSTQINLLKQASFRWISK